MLIIHSCKFGFGKLGEDGGCLTIFVNYTMMSDKMLIPSNFYYDVQDASYPFVLMIEFCVAEFEVKSDNVEAGYPTPCFDCI